MKEHATLGASSSHRWMNCAGAPRMEKGIKDYGSVHAAEGTAAHDLADTVLVGIDPIEVYLGKAMGNFIVDEDMIDAIGTYLEAVGDALTHEDVLWWSERRFNLDMLDPPAPMFGTSDFVAYDPREKLLTVIDLKYGRGVIVEVKDNPQILYYGLGALLDIEKNFPQYEIEKIKLMIAQPRAEHPDGPVRSVIIDYQDLVAFAVSLLKKAEATTDPEAPLTPGDWCRWCKAAPVCPALQKQAMAVAKREFSELPMNLPPSPEKLSITELVTVLDNADILVDWIKSVRSHVMGILERGGEVPGYKAVPKRAMRKWIDEDDVVDHIRSVGITADEVFERKLRSPAQIEKILKRLKEKLPENLWVKNSSGFNLAPTSDPRPQILLGAGADFVKQKEEDV